MGAEHSQTLSETPRLLTDAPSVGCAQEPDVSPQVLKSARNYTGGNTRRSNYMARIMQIVSTQDMQRSCAA